MRAVAGLLALLLLLSVPAAGVLAAQQADAPDGGLTLKEAVRLALERSHDVLSAQSQLEQMSALRGKAGAAVGWRLDGAGSATHQKAPATVQVPYELAGQEVPEAYTTYLGSIVLSKGFLWAPENRIPMQQADVGLESAREQLRLTRASVFKSVAEAYYGVWKAKDAVDLATASVDDAGRALDIAIRKRDAASGTESDVMAAQGKFLQAQAGLATARRLLDLSLKRLSSLIDHPDLKLSDLVPPAADEAHLAEEPVPWPWSPDEMVSQALANRPEVRLTELAVRSAGLEEELARAQGRPQISLSGSYTLAEDRIRLDTDLKSTGRWTAAISSWDDTLPDVERQGSPAMGSNPGSTDWGAISQGSIGDGRSAASEPEDTWEVKLDVTFNFFDAGLARSGLEQAAAKARQASLEVVSTKDLIELEVLQLYSRLLDAHGTAKTAMANLEQARQLRRESLGAKGYGALTPQDESRLDILVLQRTVESRSALYDYELAKISLGVALGLEPDLIMGYSAL